MRWRERDATTIAEPGTLRLDGVGVTVDDRVLLDDVTLELTAPRIAVIGANGSGKSTFARLLNGLMTPTTGTVTVHGLDALRERTAVRRRVGFVFTDPDAQILMPTPAEDLALSLRGRPRDEIAARVQENLERHGLGAHADIPASSLSGGQKQMLALAAVLLAEPALIVADEPTTLLDLRNARRIGDLLLSQEAQVLIVTHDLELAARCDTAVLFDGGCVVEQGEPERVIARYRRLCA
ncbi:MAG: ABC transporter ATP-binding protein [Microbacterium sp.]|nr:ABC transporter ATP-binding protein [Microbacterium sp.]